MLKPGFGDLEFFFEPTHGLRKRCRGAEGLQACLLGRLQFALEKAIIGGLRSRVEPLAAAEFLKCRPTGARPLAPAEAAAPAAKGLDLLHEAEARAFVADISQDG